jgi:hypothetical protein
MVAFDRTNTFEAKSKNSLFLSICGSTCGDSALSNLDDSVEERNYCKDPSDGVSDANGSSNSPGETGATPSNEKKVRTIAEDEWRYDSGWTWTQAKWEALEQDDREKYVIEGSGGTGDGGRYVKVWCRWWIKDGVREAISYILYEHLITKKET